MKHLIGHTSPETAFEVNGYPYGFKLRCKIRYWLEYSPRFGYRLCSQTTNPKVSSEVWNKPKCSIYNVLAVMIQKEPNEKGIAEVTWEGLNVYNLKENLEAFVTAHNEALQGPNEQAIIAGFRAAIARYEAREKAKQAVPVEQS